MAVVPKPPAFDAAAHDARHSEVIHKPDGSPYPAILQFAGWKKWVDKQRDHLEALRVGVFGPNGIKTDLDEHSGRLQSLEARIAAVEAQPVARFP